MRKIAVITGTRAEYGHLFWTIKGIHESPELELQLVVTGMHLSPEFGMTIKEIEKDGFPITERVEMLLSSDTESAISTSMGLGMIGFANVYERLKPDIIVVLGDRFEVLSAVSASIPFRIPVAHIHGGETTEGVIDEPIRHSISKMSHVHFPTTKKYEKRILQMGEFAGNVFCFGAPSLDNIYNLNLMKKEDLLCNLDLPQDKKIGVVTYHPVTLEKGTSETQISELLNALKRFTDVFWVFTAPNADTEGRILMKKIDEFVKRYPEKGKLFINLGQVRYLSLLKYVCVMVGNSSSGIIEAPSFKLPVVNVGERQQGRIRAQNVIDIAECKEHIIFHAIERALSSKFKNSLSGLESPYGKGDSSSKIVAKLKEINLGERLIKKKFCDIL
jgi:UDP-N-acetylglucosamine 2-epimerase (non-hydrolysing)/GDP/UDP-N,N'-diacetylbacillosamine 2-epimerase (hydrolysing)